MALNKNNCQRITAQIEVMGHLKKVLFTKKNFPAHPYARKSSDLNLAQRRVHNPKYDRSLRPVYLITLIL